MKLLHLLYSARNLKRTAAAAVVLLLLLLFCCWKSPRSAARGIYRHHLSSAKRVLFLLNPEMGLRAGWASEVCARPRQ
jgi:hypothetical protein